jgi:hypothetical protein
MDAMTAPYLWSGQDRMLTVEDMENMPDDEFRYELDDGVLIVSPALTVFELRQGSYEQTAHVTGDEDYHAVLPFPVTVVPSQLVTLG